jgi:Na+/proline symporter
MSFKVALVVVVGTILAAGIELTQANCLENDAFEAEFASLLGVDSLPYPGSCCMKDVCNIPCPEPVSEPSALFGVAVGFAIGLSFIIGMLTFFYVDDEIKTYFIAGKSLSVGFVFVMLSSQAIDSNMLLGNVDLSYKYSFYDGAVFPVGLGLSLILNGILFARKINSMDNILTLPDVFAVRYGKVVEVLVSLITITSFLMLLAGNLVGMGFVTSYVWGTSQTLGIWVSAYIVWAYTVGGGLFSIAYADVVQGALGWYVFLWLQCFFAF